MTATAHALIDGLTVLCESLTDLGHTHARDGRPPIHNDFLSKLLSCIFLENKAFQDDPEWGNETIATISDILIDNYMSGYNSIQ